MTLGTFRGSAVSYQRFLSDATALRAGLSVALAHDSVAASEEYSGEIDFSGEVDLTCWSHSVSGVCELIVHRGSAAGFYFGGGLQGSYLATRDEGADFSYGNDGPVVHYALDEHSSWAAGLTGVLGTYWAAGEWLAFHAEYRVSALYRHDTYDEQDARLDEEIEISHEEREMSRVSFRSEGVTAGVSVFF